MRDARETPFPPPLMVAASVTALEGLLVVAYGALEAANLHEGRAAMGVTTSAFFLILGGALIACAWLIGRGRPGARSPVIVVQVILLGLAWNFWGGSTTWVSVGLAAVSIVVLAGLLHPASTAALTGDRGARDRAE